MRMRTARRVAPPGWMARRGGGRVALWFMAVGTLLLALGIVAAINLLEATIATTYLVAGMMVAGGAVQIVHAAGVRRWMRTVGWGLAGSLYFLAALALLRNPLLSAAVLTLLLIAALIAAGLVRCGLALAVRPDGWGWLVLSGLFSMVAAFVLALRWPVNALWIPGLLLAVDLLLQGLMYLMIGMLFRSSKRKYA